MKKALISGIIVLSIVLVAELFKIDPEYMLITIMAYWIFLDRLEKEERNDD